MEIPLTKLAAVVKHCWDEAEQATSNAVKKYFAPAEENITFLFARELHATLEMASSTRQIEKAFLEDLRREIPLLPSLTVQRMAGLVARANFHSRYHEGKRSAADLGVVVRRPLVQTDRWSTKVELSEDHASGLLAQAKLGLSSDSPTDKYSWGGFTKKQEKLYGKRRDYYSLLLYRISGENADQLNAFGWQLCHKYSLKQVKQWLRLNKFPDERPSSNVLKQLFAGKIGTQKPNIIKTIIDPTASELCALEIHIFWPDGKKPPKYTSLAQPQQKQVALQILQH